MSMCVPVCVCVGVCLRAYHANSCPKFTNFSEPVAMARSSGGVAVLCTSGFVGDVAFS